jgi:hypothetical protein
VKFSLEPRSHQRLSIFVPESAFQDVLEQLQAAFSWEKVVVVWRVDRVVRPRVEAIPVEVALSLGGVMLGEVLVRSAPRGVYSGGPIRERVSIRPDRDPHVSRRAETGR